MPRCDVCGNDDEFSFEVVHNGVFHTFDCFECAIHKLAPLCHHCGCRIVGHIVESRGLFYCCAHCAQEQERRQWRIQHSRLRRMHKNSFKDQPSAPVVLSQPIK